MAVNKEFLPHAETQVRHRPAPKEASNWLRRSWARLGSARKTNPKPYEVSKPLNTKAIAAATNALPQPQPLTLVAQDMIAITDRAMRSTHQRLAAAIKQKNEALSPRLLRQSLAHLQAIADTKISEAEAARRAKDVADWYLRADSHARYDMWLLLSEQFAPQPDALRIAREALEAASGTAGEGAAQVLLRKALESPRRRLLQRFAAFDDGISFLVNMRQEWLPALKTDARLLALDDELEALFSTWFDLAFLELRRISWDSPASLLEKLIRYEAVHDIKSWSDLKNRLDSDRRCYGFFHPRMAGVPLIFVQVAFTRELAASIPQLLDEAASVEDIQLANTAIFYSISNTQVGLRGVGFGDSLIKRVVETLKQEFPRLKTFATLSPIPGLRAWLQKADPQLASDLDARLQNSQSPIEKTHQTHLLAQAAHYLTQELRGGLPLDAVAKFHLSNGARVQRLHLEADPSAKGLKQSFGLMVNYLYDLKYIDRYRQSLHVGKIAYSADIKKHLSHV